MTDLDLAPIEARMNAATPGPWEQWVGNNEIFAGPLDENKSHCCDNGRGQICAIAGDYDHVYSQRADDDFDEEEYENRRDADADFISHSIEDVPALVAEVKRLWEIEKWAMALFASAEGRQTIYINMLRSWTPEERESFALMLEDRSEDGACLISRERRRQKDVEGWTPEHDDAHIRSELLSAAHAYMYASNGRRPELQGKLPPQIWPWSYDYWKPSTQIRNLAKAGALIAAEIDRLQRKEAQTDGDV